MTTTSSGPWWAHGRSTVCNDQGHYFPDSASWDRGEPPRSGFAGCRFWIRCRCGRLRMYLSIAPDQIDAIRRLAKADGRSMASVAALEIYGGEHTDGVPCADAGAEAWLSTLAEDVLVLRRMQRAFRDSPDGPLYPSGADARKTLQAWRENWVAKGDPPDVLAEWDATLEACERADARAAAHHARRAQALILRLEKEQQ